MRNDRLDSLPFSLISEQATLGAMLFSYDARIELLDKLEEDDFYDVKHKSIFRHIKGFVHDNTPCIAIDKITFYNYLKSKNAIENCGGINYIESLSSNAPITSNAVAYAKTVKNYALRRKAIEQAEKLKDNALSETLDINDVISTTCSSLADIQINGSTASEFDKVSTLLKKNADEVIQKSMLGASAGIYTGFTFLDQKIGGFRPAQYIVMAARPSCGKTALALSIMSNMLNAKTDYIIQGDGEYSKQNKDVHIGFFSLEMPKEDIVKRLMSMRSLIPYWKINNNKIGWANNTPPSTANNKEADTLLNAVGNFYNVADRLFIYDASSMTLNNIKMATRQLMKHNKIDVLFIDYFSRIVTDRLGGSMSKDFEKWNIVSRELKSLAKELNIPIVVLSQLTRTAETTRPTLADLRYTGALEQDADIVILLHNPQRSGDVANTVQGSGNYYENGIKHVVNRITQIEVNIAKQRNGEIGMDKLYLLGDYVRFVDRENVELGVIDDKTN